MELLVVGFTKFAGAEKCRALEAAVDVVEGAVEARIHVVEAMLGLILGTHMASAPRFLTKYSSTLF